MTLASLSSGLLGSALGATITFGAAAFTLWRTRVGDRRREAARAAERDQERRESLIGQVVASLRAIESEVRWAPLLRGRAMRHFLEVAMTFYASQRREHPEVAGWLLAQCGPYQHVMDRWHRVCLVPVLNKRRLLAVGQLTGEISAAVLGWVTGEIPDRAFADPELPPMDIAKLADRMRGTLTVRLPDSEH